MNVVIDGDDDVLLAMRAAHYERNFADRSFDIEFLEKHAAAVRTIGDLHASPLACVFSGIFPGLIIQLLHKII